MKAHTEILAVLVLIAALAGSTVAETDPMQKLGLPTLPDATLVTQIEIPPGNLLDGLARDYGPWLGITSLSQVTGLVYDINRTRGSQDIYGLLGPAVAQQNWKTMVLSFSNNKAVAVLYNEQSGMLIVNIDAPGEERQATIIRFFGTIDPTKVANPKRRLPDLFRQVIQSAIPGATGASVLGASRIPIGQPISVAPSRTLHVQTTRSAVNAQIFDRPTVEIRLTSRTDDPGELVRVEDRLVLALTPKLDVSEMFLPGPFPILLELTEGSLDLSCGPGPNDRPSRLNISSTGTLVNVQSLPLISGTHTVKSVGGEVRMSLSAVLGGVLSVEVTGKNLTFSLPKVGSARIQAFTTSGRIENQTGLPPEESGPDHLGLKIGSGVADITLRAINGNIVVTCSD